MLRTIQLYINRLNMDRWEKIAHYFEAERDKSATVLQALEDYYFKNESDLK